MPKKAVLIIAQKGYQPKELQDTEDALRENGIKTTVAARENSIAFDSVGGSVKSDISIAEIRAEEYNGIVFIGGQGALEYCDNKASYALIREFDAKNKIIAAICIAPVILARAGIMKERKTTVHPSGASMVHDFAREVSADEVVEDQNVITGNGPQAAKAFGTAIAKKLLSASYV